MPLPRNHKNVLPSDTRRSRLDLLPTRNIEHAVDNPKYCAVWLYVDMCAETHCKKGHWSLKVDYLGQETLYRVAGHSGSFCLQILNGVSAKSLEGGLLQPVAAVDSQLLRVMLASVTVDNVREGWCSQDWAWNILDELLAGWQGNTADPSLMEILTTRAWNFAG